MKSIKNKNKYSNNKKIPIINKTLDLTARSLKLAVLAAVIAMLSIISHRLGIIDYQIALFGLATTVLCSLSAIVFGSIGTWRVKQAGDAEITATMSGSTLGLLVVAPILVEMMAGWGKPMIHDISTDLVNPPEFIAIKAVRDETHNTLSRLEPTNLNTLQQENYPDLGPLIVEDSVDRIFERAVALVKKRGWEVIAVSAANGRIEATDTTLIMGFKDDVVIRIQAEDEVTRVDMRSVSRVGKGDLGVNASRIRSFLDDLQG